MKRLSIVFWILSVLLSDVMCAVVAYTYCDMQWGIKYGGYSANAGTAFFLVIPFLIGIVLCIVLALVCQKKALRNKQ